MGASSDRDEYDYYFDQQLKRQNERIIQSIVELNRKANEKINQDIQNQLDKKKRDFIIRYKRMAGYNVNPYKLSSSELDFWEKKIYKKIEQEQLESIKNIDKFYSQFHNSYDLNSIFKY